MPVVSVKVPRDIKDKMSLYRDKVNWPEEIRKFLAAKIEELEREEALKKALSLLKNVRPTPKGTAEALVREDRESH